MRILTILYPPRQDLFFYLLKDKTDHYDVLWFENEREEQEAKSETPSFFQKRFYWNNYLTPAKLLKKAKPDRIVFMEIIDQRQIALIVAARKMRIPTFYLEHGSAGDKRTAIKRHTLDKEAELKKSVRQKRRPLIHLFRVKLFYYSNISGFASFSAILKYWKLPLLMLRHLPNKALSICIFREKIPDHCIVFNKSNFEEFRVYTGITEKDAVFTGLPFFDHYFNTTIKELDHIIYIEHPMYESGLLGWTLDHHKSIATRLLELAESKKTVLFVKLHPRSDAGLWQEYTQKSSYFKVIREGDFTQLYLSAKLILGYSSSLITGLLCAKKNIVNIGWHPDPQIFGIDFSEFGICHRSLHVSEINPLFDYWLSNNLCHAHSEKYSEFIREFNHPFDGKAAGRVISSIKNG